MDILLESSPLALWQNVVKEAEAQCATPLTAEVEAYLILLLMRYMKDPQVIQHIIAEDVLKSLHLKRQARHEALQQIGDKCLLFSGLFPQLAKKRLVTIRYYVDMGQSAYQNLSRVQNDVYAALAEQFTLLIDILHTLRDYSKDHPTLLPLEAWQLWHDIQSPRALKILQSYTTGIPVSSTPGTKRN